jgi:hypothetical protein
MDNPNDMPAVLAERVRAACLRAALDAWEDAGLRGLCGDGRWEYAVGALRHLDLAPLIDPAYDRTGTTGRKSR